MTPFIEIEDGNYISLALIRAAMTIVVAQRMVSLDICLRSTD